MLRFLAAGALAAVLLPCAGRATVPEVPMRPAERFVTAYDALLRSGWHPRVTHVRLEARSGLPILARLRGLAREYYFAGHAEVQECGAAGADRCTFNYLNDDGACLQVATRGVDLAQARVEQWRFDCPPPDDLAPVGPDRGR